jgi:hypothetical protein
VSDKSVPLRLQDHVVLLTRSHVRICEVESGDEVMVSPATLAYILQEYRREFGGFPVLADFSQWRGVEGL